MILYAFIILSGCADVPKYLIIQNLVQYDIEIGFNIGDKDQEVTKTFIIKTQNSVNAGVIPELATYNFFVKCGSCNEMTFVKSLQLDPTVTGSIAQELVKIEASEVISSSGGLGCQPYLLNVNFEETIPEDYQFAYKIDSDKEITDMPTEKKMFYNGIPFQVQIYLKSSPHCPEYYKPEDFLYSGTFVADEKDVTITTEQVNALCGVARKYCFNLINYKDYQFQYQLYDLENQKIGEAQVLNLENDKATVEFFYKARLLVKSAKCDDFVEIDKDFQSETEEGDCEAIIDLQIPDQCKFSCDVDHCVKCVIGDPKKCENCDTSYTTNTEGQCELIPTDQCLVDHCEKCVSGDPNKCEKCDTSYTTNTEGQCELIPTDQCLVDHCEKCVSGDPNKCEKCDTSYTTNTEGQCELISTDQCKAVDEKDAELGDCVECSDDKKTCTKCFNSEYIIPNAKGECVLKCIVGQDHCSECNADFTECSKCDSNALKPNGHRCSCEGEDNEYVDGQCVKIIESWKPTEVKPESFGTISEQNGVQTIDTSAITTADPSKYYTQEISGNAREIKIVNKNNANVLLTLKPVDGEVSVQLDSEDTKATLVCPDEAKIKLNNAPNVIINAKGSLNINPIDANLNEIKVGKVVLYDSVESITSDKNLVITELQVFNRKKFKATKENIKIETVKIEQGGVFIPSSNLQLTKIEIGVNSELEVSDAWKDSEITIYYNRPQPDMIEDMVLPLTLNALPNSFPKSFTIKKKELGQLLEDKDYYVSVVSEIENVDVNAKCKQLASLYKSEDAVFRRADCKPYELRGKKSYLLYATNASSSKKKGLSGGAIAGIVIGCVAVVAIAAVLIWYFVFYRKSKVGASEDAEP